MSTSNQPEQIKAMPETPPNPEVIRLFDFLWWTAAGCPKDTAPKR